MNLNLTQNMGIALRALSANKLRSALTMLGIVIGVASVVALLAIGAGAQAAITQQIESIGSNLIVVIAGSQNNVAVAGDAPARLTLNDARQLDGLPGVAAVAPVYQATMRVTYRGRQVNVPLTGVTPEFAEVHPDLIDKGRFVTTSDQNNRARVVMLGSQAATDLFGAVNPVGQSVRINGVLFKVVGVLKPQGVGGFGNANATSYAPLETVYARLARAAIGNDRIVSTIQVSAAGADRVDPALNQITQALRRSHRLKPGEDDDFSVISQTDILSAATTITGVLTVFLGAIAAISLLVGGIGIMNIMLVSVTERTREIGLRKAVGARRRDILYQFLVETVTLSLIGGMLGIAFGSAIAFLVNLSGVLTTVVSIESILLAFGFSAAVGVFFGLYPAGRAASLRPIEALRYE